MPPKSGKKKAAAPKRTPKTTTSKPKTEKKEKPLPVIACLAAEGLTYDRTVNDGNCLFRALSLQIFGGQERFEEVRAKVVQYIKDYQRDYENFVVGELLREVLKRGCKKAAPKEAPKQVTKKVTKKATKKSKKATKEKKSEFEQYVEKMAEDGTWGGDIEISAFSLAYDMEVLVYQEREKCRPYNIEEGKARKLAMVCRQGKCHYVSVKKEPAAEAAPTSTASPSPAASASPAPSSTNDLITANTTPAPPTNPNTSDDDENDEPSTKFEGRRGLTRRHSESEGWESMKKMKCGTVRYESCPANIIYHR